MNITKAERDVLNERRRQIDEEKWTPEHDDQHAYGELATAGAFYTLHAIHGVSPSEFRWPWDMSWWKPKDRRYDLVRAASLIMAEIERLDRANAESDRVQVPSTSSSVS